MLVCIVQTMLLGVCSYQTKLKQIFIIFSIMLDIGFPVEIPKIFNSGISRITRSTDISICRTCQLLQVFFF